MTDTQLQANVSNLIFSLSHAEANSQLERDILVDFLRSFEKHIRGEMSPKADSILISIIAPDKSWQKILDLKMARSSRFDESVAEVISADVRSVKFGMIQHTTVKP